MKILGNQTIHLFSNNQALLKMNPNKSHPAPSEIKILAIATVALVLMAYAPNLLADSFQDACTKVGGFVDSLVGILGFVSAGIVTVAIIFAGYQISFAHKRFSDVAPILIGGLLIGGAAQIALWFVGAQTACTAIS